MKKLRTKKIILSIGLFGLALVVAAGLFIKYDTPAAAEFTDNVLRPILGPGVVIPLEAFYYNFSDKLQQTMYNPKSDTGVTFVDVGNTANISIHGSDLNLTPIPVTHSYPADSGEGVWQVRPLAAFPNQAVAAYTYVRPDPERPYANVTIFQLDMRQVKMGATAGTQQPGGPVGMPGPGVVPPDIISSGKLLAAFDGGFQYRDGQYGMIVGNTTYLPLKDNLATIVGYKDGSLKILNYTGQSLAGQVDFVRQNCPMLVADGRVATTNQEDKKLWGRTLTAGIYTWRSGMGLTKNGNLLFAVGNNLTPTTLATALQMAGAENAMQLDINPYWVRFNIFDTIGNGQYKTSTLVKDIHDGSFAYLHGYNKDFFYLYKK